MTKHTLIDAINRPMNALRYSLARYLRFARPWVDAYGQPVAETIGRVAEGHTQHVTRIGELLVERHGHVESRTFPRAFVGLNDLSVEYLLPLVIEDEEQIIRVIEATEVALECDAEASNLLAEVLDTEKRHLQMLEWTSNHRHAKGVGKTVAARRQAVRWRSTYERPLGQKAQVMPSVREAAARSR